jgi:hypothetical protein
LRNRNGRYCGLKNKPGRQNKKKPTGGYENETHENFAGI